MEIKYVHKELYKEKESRIEKKVGKGCREREER